MKLPKQTDNFKLHNNFKGLPPSPKDNTSCLTKSDGKNTTKDKNKKNDNIKKDKTLGLNGPQHANTYSSSISSLENMEFETSANLKRLREKPTKENKSSNLKNASNPRYRTFHEIRAGGSRHLTK